MTPADLSEPAVPLVLRTTKTFHALLLSYGAQLLNLPKFTSRGIANVSWCIIGKIDQRANDRVADVVVQGVRALVVCSGPLELLHAPRTAHQRLAAFPATGARWIWHCDRLARTQSQCDNPTPWTPDVARRQATWARQHDRLSHIHDFLTVRAWLRVRGEG